MVAPELRTPAQLVTAMVNALTYQEMFAVAELSNVAASAGIMSAVQHDTFYRVLMIKHPKWDIRLCYDMDVKDYEDVGAPDPQWAIDDALSLTRHRT